jgi:hypothetical protein
MPTLPPPPVPQGLRELLKNYPGHIQRLQDALNSYVQKPFRPMPFDGAIWALEGRLEAFILEAREELENAETGGDQDSVARAKEKEMLFLRARNSNGGMSDMNELWDYIRLHEGAFR